MNSPETHRYLRYALRRVLRSIAGLLIRGGVRFDEFADLVRSIYVDSAIRDSNYSGTPSRERIAMLTGLTRRQVYECVDNDGTLPTADPTLRALLVDVLQKWHTLPQYAGPYGIPLELEFEAPVDRCFRSLVMLVDPKANPRKALNELLRAGAVAQAGGKHFRATSRFFMMPDPTSPELIERFGMTLSRLATTLDYNMDPKHPDRRLERFVIADRGLPSDLLPEFEKYTRSRAVEFLVDLDNWLAQQVSTESGGGQRLDTGVNVFLHEKPLAQEEPLASLVSAGIEASTNG